MSWGHDEGHVLFAGRELANRLNRIQSYREMPLWLDALGEAVDSQEAVA
jgi:hypothetical protein